MSERVRRAIRKLRIVVRLFDGFNTSPLRPVTAEASRNGAGSKDGVDSLGS